MESNHQETQSEEADYFSGKRLHSWGFFLWEIY